jgi:hypothetical protein
MPNDIVERLRAFDTSAMYTAAVEITSLRAELAAANERASQMQRRLDAAMAGRLEYRRQFEMAEDRATVLGATIATLTAERDGLRRALEWYANPEIYKPHPHGPVFDRRDLSFHAREALALRDEQEGAALSVSPAGEG